MPYRTILVATDGSESALIAQRRAIGLARPLWAKVLIVTAFSEPGIPRDAAEDVLRYAAQDARRGEVDVHTLLLEGPPGEALPSAAADGWADLVVVGSAGMGKPTRLRMGTVADQVVRAVPCDVLVVRTTGPTPSDPGRGYRTIVAGTDGSPTATEAARRAFELGEVVNAGVTLTSVGDPLLSAIALEKTVKGHPGGSEPTTMVREGDPVEEICALAAERGADLIVVGNQGLAGLKGRLLGSVPGDVAHRASCDVLITRTGGHKLEDLTPGRAAVVVVDGRKAAAYVDEAGNAHVLSARCRHLGCTVGWNDADRTWDCPCHGSRYTFEGVVIQGPATKDLPPLAEDDVSGS